MASSACDPAPTGLSVQKVRVPSPLFRGEAFRFTAVEQMGPVA
jgi:hypothetical protein